MSPARQSSVAQHAEKVTAELEKKPRPQIGYLNGYVCLWTRPGDLHCLAAGVVTSTIQVQAKEAIDEFLKENAE